MSDHIPTVEEMLEADAKLYREAISACHGFGMDAKTLTRSVMVYLRGKGNPAVVYQLAVEYLGNGLRFKT